MCRALFYRPRLSLINEEWPDGHAPLAQGETLGLPVGAGAVALEPAKAGSTPYPGEGYGRNPDVRVFVVAEWCQKVKWLEVLFLQLLESPNPQLHSHAFQDCREVAN